MALTFTRLTSGGISANATAAGGGAARPLRIRDADDVVCVFGAVTFDTSYSTGGMACPPSAVGLKEIFFFLTDGATTGSTGAASAVDGLYNYTNQTLMAYGGAVGALTYSEIPAYTNLSWVTMRFIAFGRR